MNNPQPRQEDMSWAGFLGVFAVMLVLAALLIPVPNRGPGGVGLVPADCLPSLLATVAAGALAVVLSRVAISRKRSRRYSTPRRDIAISSLVISAALLYFWPLVCFP